MAEAIYLPSITARYFCYQCDREVSLTPSPQLICPDCSSGFLEEVSDGVELNYHTSDSGEDSEVDESELNFLNLLSIESMFRRTLYNTVVGNRLDSIDDGTTDSARNNTQSESSDLEAAPNETVISLIARNFGRNIQIDDFLARQNTELRHIGDYLFGDDLDALSTMLLNDTEIAGPPPLPKEQIKLLQVVTICKEDVDKKVQCTICMDDFVVREKAKCLPCSHLYHEKCIVPWLERHSTCPNCRKRVEVKERKRSHSCPRSEYNLRRSTEQRRSSESASFSGFFSRNPFRFM